MGRDGKRKLSQAEQWAKQKSRPAPIRMEQKIAGRSGSVSLLSGGVSSGGAGLRGAIGRSQALADGGWVSHCRHQVICCC